MKSKLITLIIIGLATWLATYIGGSVFPLLGTAISAILIGMIIRHTPFIYNLLDKATNKFITSYVLKGGIVLLGFTMSIQVLNKVGSYSYRCNGRCYFRIYYQQVSLSIKGSKRIVN